MKIKRLEPECISCLLTKQINKYPEETTKENKIEYIRRLLKMLSGIDETISAPQIMSMITNLQTEMFGAPADYSDVKRHFNEIMMKREEDIKEKIKKSKDPLKSGIQYSMTGNYIDFAAMINVDENKLNTLLNEAQNIIIPQQEIDRMKNSLKKAKTLVYLTDNCGEIVLDKLLISVISDLYPDISITAVVRGYPVINDATMDDAVQTGLDKTINVIDNGSSVAGTNLDGISEIAEKTIKNADIIISKGQGNFETLRGCGLNIFYIFMCKCPMFAKRFNVPVLTGILINDSEL